MPSVSRVECIARQPCDRVQMGEQLPVSDGLEAPCETVQR